MNGLKFDSDVEERAVELFALNIMKAENPFLKSNGHTIHTFWSRVKSAIPDFLTRLKKTVDEDNKEYK